MKIETKEKLMPLVSYGGLLSCIIIFTIINGVRMWSAYNIGVLIEASCVYSILAIGSIFVYSMGYMDISVSAQFGVYCILIIKIINNTGSLLLGFLGILILALICGAINGGVAVLLKLPSIVTSIFLSFIFTGIQILLMERTGLNTIAVNYDFVLLKNQGFMLFSVVAIYIVGYIIYEYTKLGLYVRCIGSNEEATKQAGVETTRWKILAYMLFGVCVSIGAVYLTARTGSAGKGTGSTYAMDVLIAIVLGGMPLSGGMKSKMSSAVIGTLTYCILSNGLTLSGVDTTLVNFIKGIIFFVIILFTCRKKTGVLPK